MLKLRQIDKVIIAVMLYHEQEKCGNTACTIGLTARVRKMTDKSDMDIFKRLDILETAGIVVNVGFMSDSSGDHVYKWQLSDATKTVMHCGGIDVRKVS